MNPQVLRKLLRRRVPGSRPRFTCGHPPTGLFPSEFPTCHFIPDCFWRHLLTVSTLLKKDNHTPLSAMKVKNLLVSNIQFLLFPDCYVLIFFLTLCVPVKIHARLNRLEVSDLAAAWLTHSGWNTYIFSGLLCGSTGHRLSGLSGVLKSLLLLLPWYMQLY